MMLSMDLPVVAGGLIALLGILWHILLRYSDRQCRAPEGS